MSKYSLTITADTETELFARIAQFAALHGEDAPTGPAEPAKRGPGRPRKESVVAVQAPSAPAVETPAAPATPVAPPVVSAPVTEAKVYTKAEVQTKLIEVVTKVSKEACVALCAAHGGANLSAIDPSNYSALYADAVKLLS